MSDTPIPRKPDLTISTVEEKIILEKQLPFSSHKKGPTIDLFFHELIAEKSSWQTLFRFLGSVVLGIFFIATLPIVALLIKAVSKESIFEKIEVPGQRGIIFHQYKYSTKDSQTQEYFRLGKLLEKLKIAKLPSVMNMWNGEMNLVGPRPYPAEWCNKWNKQLCEYYKRFAIRPGYVDAVDPITDYHDIESVANSLDQELKYILNPSLKKDLRRLFHLRD